MAHADWNLKARRLVTCNCDWGCPCEFMAPPTNGHCEGVEAWEIVSGHFKNVRLDNIRLCGTYHWPGAVHEGHGKYQMVVDDSVSAEQMEALETIMSGEEQEPHSLFAIYGSTLDTFYDTITAPIEFEWDIENLRGLVKVEGVLEAIFEPIRNPVTGKIHRAALKLIDGFDFREAEMISGDYWAKGDNPVSGTGRFAYITCASYGPYGVIEEESHPKALI